MSLSTENMNHIVFFKNASFMKEIKTLVSQHHKSTIPKAFHFSFHQNAIVVINDKN